MEKDLNRLKLISDRFGKIGSTPKLEEYNITDQVQKMVTYIKRRATDKVSFNVEAPANPVITKISAPLFDWVIENLLKKRIGCHGWQRSYQYKNKRAHWACNN